MTANEFLAYIDYFHSKQYDAYYTDDIVFHLPTKLLVGKQAVKDWYNHLNQFVEEILYVKKVLSEGDVLMAHIGTDFRCIKDWPDFTAKPLKKGEVYHGEYLILYKIRGGKFCEVSSARLTS